MTSQAEKNEPLKGFSMGGGGGGGVSHAERGGGQEWFEVVSTKELEVLAKLKVVGVRTKFEPFIRRWGSFTVF